MTDAQPLPVTDRLVVPERAADDGIELVGEGTGSLFSGLLNTYEQRGFERGYRQAVSDLLSSLLWVTEEHLRSPPPGGPVAVSPADARRLVYHFEERLEHHILSLSPDAHYVSDGLGI